MAKTADYTRRAVDNYRAKFDTAQIRLPKGTRERAKAANANINDIAVSAVLAYLDDLERKAEELPNAEKEQDKKDARTFTDSPEDLQAANEWLHQLQAQIASQKKKDSAAMGEELVKKFKNNCN